jgi:hypothetical protein
MRARDLVEVQKACTKDALRLELLEWSPRGVGHEPSGIEDRHVACRHSITQAGWREQIRDRRHRGHESEWGSNGPPDTKHTTDHGKFEMFIYLFFAIDRLGPD